MRRRVDKSSELIRLETAAAARTGAVISTLVQESGNQGEDEAKDGEGKTNIDIEP